MAKGFWLGVLVTLLALCAAGYIYFEAGFVSIRADTGPAFLDRWLGAAMDASTRRHAPSLPNPVPANESNLVDGARLYIDKCAGCHGSPVNPDSDLGRSFSPRVPQFFGKDPPDMPAHQDSYIIKHGVRMTAMPAWGNVMADSEIWQVIDLLQNLKHLPDAAQQELRKPTAAPAP